MQMCWEYDPKRIKIWGKIYNIILLENCKIPFERRRDTQHNDIQHNDIQRNAVQ